MDDNRRRFKRIPFDAQIRLTLSESEAKPISGILQDISLKGALIVVSETIETLKIGQRGKLLICPDQGEFELNLMVEVAYTLKTRHAYGLNLVSLDIESAGHLRRLVEVNLGDDDGMQRELSNLIDAMEQEHRK